MEHFSDWPCDLNWLGPLPRRERPRSTMACQRPPEVSCLWQYNQIPGDCTYCGYSSSQSDSDVKRCNWNAKETDADLPEILGPSNIPRELFPKNKRVHSTNSIFQKKGV
jgi:hypothetical protein